MSEPVDVEAVRESLARAAELAVNEALRQLRKWDMSSDDMVAASALLSAASDAVGALAPPAPERVWPGAVTEGGGAYFK